MNDTLPRTAPATMRAVRSLQYGAPTAAGTLEVASLDVPAVAKGEVLVRVAAAAVCRGDWHLATGRPYVVRLLFGLRRPKFPIAGQAFAGHVIAVGDGVTRFQPGDAVFGQGDSGAYAEYVAANESTLSPAPAGVTLEEAATIPLSGFTALQGLRLGDKLRAGARILVHGASGGIGSLAVQIAKHTRRARHRRVRRRQRGVRARARRPTA